jgi:phage FluMu protein Com
VDFEEIVCYSQTVILVLLAVGYLLNLRKKNSTVSSKIEVKCPSCNYTITDKNVQYCAKCGNMLSHSEGLALEK